MQLLVEPGGRIQTWRVPRRHPPFFRTKKLALIGNTQSKHWAPWHDASWTTAAHCCVKPFAPVDPDWWFDLHPRPCFTQKKGWNRHYYQWLQQLKTPIFMQEEFRDIPAAIRYPKERIIAEFGTYFTNHIAWMIALAMTEGVTHIGLFGCEYRHEDERGIQRGSCEYWLGRFQQLGGHVVLPPRSTLLAVPKELYGYESHDAHGKLVPSYRPKRLLPQRHHTLGTVPEGMVPIDPNSPERPPLMPPPPGVEIAWHRSGYTIHQ